MQYHSFVLLHYSWIPRDKETETDHDVEENPPLVSIPYVSGVSDNIRRVCNCHFNIRVVFKSDQSLQLILKRVKDK